MAVTDNVIHSGTAPDTTLAADITSGSTTITITSGTGYASPTGGQISYITLAKATSAEELVSYTGRSGTSLTGCIRGLGGTSAAAHLAGVSVYHGWTSIEADDANTAVRNTVGKVTTAGDTLVATAAGVFKRLAIGAAYKALGVNAAGTDLTYLDTLASILTATGDIPYASGASTPARLAKSTGWRTLGMNDAGTIPAYASGFPGFVFADATARDAAIVTPVKGMAAWLTGTGTIARTVYDGTAWRVWEVWGTGSPESAITATVGAMYHRTDGGASTSLYVKESGTGNTGWIAYGASAGASYGTFDVTQVYISGTGQTITTATDTAALFDLEDYDTSNQHSTASLTDRIVIATTGDYDIDAMAAWNTSAAGQRAAFITVNGSTIVDNAVNPNGYAFNIIPPFTWHLTAGDIVRLAVNQTSGGNLTLFGHGSVQRGTFLRVSRRQ